MQKVSKLQTQVKGGKEMNKVNRKMQRTTKIRARRSKNQDKQAVETKTNKTHQRKR